MRIPVFLSGLTSVLCASILFSSCETARETDRQIRKTIDLSGTWQFQLDPDSSGFDENWHLQALDDNIQLPGSLDENKKGYANTDTTNLHLNRPFKYTGPAWFRKEIEIPESWGGKRVELIMERTKPTRVWLDSSYVGSNARIFSPQVYDLTDFISAGLHTLTIVVDNNPDLVPVEGSHAYAEHTQTNWNGIIGRFALESSNPARIASARIYPDIRNRSARAVVSLADPLDTLQNPVITLSGEAWNTDTEHILEERSFEVSPNGSPVELTYEMGEETQFWSEFNPVLYQMVVTLSDGDRVLDRQSISFGMREFATADGQFTINGATTFLRGKHDASVFPLTGYPPMDTAGWTRVFRIAKDYGINHHRYHSWTPPEAAFIAADMVGVYLQPELPIWYGFDAANPEQVDFMMNEGRAIFDSYGDHASFVMFALGNEIHQDRTVLKQMIDDFRAYDDRHLFAQGSNNWLNTPDYWEGDDFWVTFRTDTERPGLTSDIRGSMSFHDSKIGEGGLINTFYPSTDWTFEKAIEESPVPVIGHETGQFQIYPNFKEMDKYTGVLKPWNLELFRRDLDAHGMLDQADDFFKASGALSAICYRADIEAAIRTPGFGGFQLLDLQDFPGQGTALVGVLDAFMDSKGIIEGEEFREFNNTVTPLLVMKKYSWQNDETFQGEIKLANYGPESLSDQTVAWQMTDAEGNEIASGEKVVSVPQGELASVNFIEVGLNEIDKAQKLTVNISLDNTEFKNDYPVWVFPVAETVTPPAEIMVAASPTSAVISALNGGGKVLLFPDFGSIRNNSVGGLFIPDFWNWAMFQGIAEQYGTNFSPGTLGLLTDPDHPVFNDFPTEFHSNWQWWPIVKNSRPMILDSTPEDYKPVVQVIDNINRNHKLGLIFEFSLGEGKLLICAADLPGVDKPEGRQLYASMIRYMQSEEFDPSTEISDSDLQALFD